MNDLKDKRYFAVLLGVATLELWVVPMFTSLWLDETATFWVIKDGIVKAVARSMYWTGQSPVYYATAWLALVLGGRHEAVLRLPSLLALGLAAVLFYKLAGRLFDRTTARLAVLAFACSEPVAYAAADARPYALGLCALVGSALLLAAWLDTGHVRYGIGYTVAVALAIYTHCLLAPALAVLGFWALSRVRRERRVPVQGLLAAWVAAGILIIPLVSQVVRFYRGRAAHSFAAVPTFRDMVGSLAPPVLVASVAAGFLLAWLISPQPKCGSGVAKHTVLLAAGWAIAPPLACFAVSVSTHMEIFVPRYYIGCEPGLALLAGWLIRSCTTNAGQRIVAAAMVIGAVLGFGSFHHDSENWSDAMRTVRSVVGRAPVPVLMASGFVEASDPRALDDPKLRDVLFAPLEIYPPGGRVVRLPYRLNEESIQYLESILPAALDHQDRFLFVGRLEGRSFEPWLSGWVAARGFQSKSLGNFGTVSAYLFSTPGAR
jgi:4-amino-4-deoxy-L-arabinose transferase-like glycosyltransferase